MPDTTNVFEWVWEHSKAEGEDRRVLMYLAFHATDEAELPYYSVIQHDLGLERSPDYAALIDSGELDVDWGTYRYRFPAYVEWVAAR